MLILFHNNIIGLNNETFEDSLLLIILIPSTIFSTILLILFIITLCVIIRTCMAKKTLDDHNQQPTYYDEITECHKAMSMEEMLHMAILSHIQNN